LKVKTTAGLCPAVVYFEKRHYEKISGNFQCFNINGKSHSWKLTDSSPSIFLSLFIAAACKIQRRKLKSYWATVTVTGDLDAGEMALKAVADIDIKFHAV
jgi:hypothetical protein